MPLHALVVDDDADDAQRVWDALTETGYTVQTAGGAAEALALYADRCPDLVVTDVSMPGYDGPTLLKALRTGGCAATFVAMTSDPTLGAMERCKEAGAAICLTKPVNLALLVAMAEHLLTKGPTLVPDEDPLDAELLGQLRLTYLDLLPERVAALRASSEPAELAKAAHKLAGASAQFGYPGLAALCRCLQRSAHAGSVAEELLDAVQAAAVHATTR
jgi:CheY-like chemotaxis protein